MSYLTNFRTLAGLTAISLIVLIVNSAYIAAFASPTIFYMGNVMVHLVLGTALAVAFVWLLFRDAVMRRELLIAAALFFFALLAAGYLLWMLQKVAFGTPKEEWKDHHIHDVGPA